MATLNPNMPPRSTTFTEGENTFSMERRSMWRWGGGFVSAWRLQNPPGSPSCPLDCMHLVLPWRPGPRKVLIIGGREQFKMVFIKSVNPILCQASFNRGWQTGIFLQGITSTSESPWNKPLTIYTYSVPPAIVMWPRTADHAQISLLFPL